MLRLWPSSPPDQLTPKPSTSEKNPFDAIATQHNPPQTLHHRAPTPSAPHTPTAIHPLLASNSASSPGTPNCLTASACGGSVHSDLTPIGPFPAAQPTTQLSTHAPVFIMQQPPPPRKSVKVPSNSSSATSSSSPPPQSATSRGQIHVKLISARGLNVRSMHARPYVVVQFEQNEFVSRDPTDESDKEVKGVPVNVSRNPLSSSSALSALGAIGSRAAAAAAAAITNGKLSKDPSPSTSLATRPPSTTATSSPSNGIPNGLFGRINAHNPVWKHEVSFDVTSEDSLISFNVYDRAVADQGFLGSVSIKPVLVHDHTVDQWYKLRPHEDEAVSGEMRVQITYEQYKTKRALTPRDFEFLKLIGRGTFGKVFQVRKKDTKRIYAMKVLSKKEIVAKKEVAHTIGERKILQRSLESPFLVGLKFSFQTNTDLYLVTDFKSGGELFWHLQRETRFSEERARFYISELILALEHLHKYNIVYRDLKPENILLDATGHVALCDFGLSKADLRPDELTTTFCGTTEYLAPEILLDEQGYSKIVDFWSLGVLLFEMCCGWSPFYAEDTQQMYKNICYGKIRFPKGVINDDGKQFVKGLLNRNPKHRLGAQRDTEELKEHPFFKHVDWKALALKQVTPPFKPVVESDESTNNFDPEFTSADIRQVGLPDLEFMDDDDPSEAWVSHSLGTHGGHMPNGPLGSERGKNGYVPLGSITNGSNGTPSKSQGIQIKKSSRRRNVASSPLTKSVQENFRGFTYHGGESVVPSILTDMKRVGEGDEEAVEDEEAPGMCTEDEVEDFTKSAGRYANARRKGELLDDMS